MNSKYRILLVSGILALSAGILTQPSFAQDASPNSAAPQKKACHHSRKRMAKSFKMGVCVGQALAQQGIAVPVSQPGQKPQPNAAMKAAFKAARQSCKAQMKGSGSGSGAPSQSAPAASGNGA